MWTSALPVVPPGYVVVLEPLHGMRQAQLHAHAGLTWKAWLQVVPPCIA